MHGARKRQLRLMLGAERRSAGDEPAAQGTPLREEGGTKFLDSLFEKIALMLLQSQGWKTSQRECRNK